MGFLGAMAGAGQSPQLPNIYRPQTQPSIQRGRNPMNPGPSGQMNQMNQMGQGGQMGQIGPSAGMMSGMMAQPMQRPNIPQYPPVQMGRGFPGGPPLNSSPMDRNPYKNDMNYNIPRNPQGGIDFKIGGLAPSYGTVPPPEANTNQSPIGMGGQQQRLDQMGQSPMNTSMSDPRFRNFR